LAVSGVGACQLVSRLLRGELPFDPRTGSIALLLPRRNFGDEDLAFADAAIQTLTT
jgi:hypothetical protein